MIGKLDRVPLREVWKHEAHDFTTWLGQNMDVLGEATGLLLETVGLEQRAGSFNIDVVAEDADGRVVVIENQLEQSDHEHLGKLLTYLTLREAKVGIWIAADPRQEHAQTITWLNESSAADFYMLKVEAVRIGDSEPAPLLTRIAEPSEEVKQVGQDKKELAERDIKRRDFWTRLLEYAATRTKLHANIAPTIHSGVSATAGVPGLQYYYSIRQHEGSAGLAINRGRGSEEENRERFEALLSRRAEIKEAFGEELGWDAGEGQRGCFVFHTVEVGGWRDEDRWPEMHEAMVDAMIRLERALKPHIARLEI